MSQPATHMTNEPLAATQREVASLIHAAREALTDSMVERLTETIGNSLEVVNTLNNPDTLEAVLHLLDRLSELKRSGAMDTAFDLIQLVHGTRMALTDSMVDRLFGFVEHMINNVGTEEMAALVHGANCALSEAVKENESKPAKGGLMATISLLGKPETQQTLQFLLSFGAKLQERAKDTHCA